MEEIEYKSITKSAYVDEGLETLRLAGDIESTEELKEILLFNMNSDFSRQTCWSQVHKRYLLSKKENINKIPLVRLTDYQGEKLNRELMYLNYLHREPIARKTVLELIYPRLLTDGPYILSRAQVKEFIKIYISYSEATMVKTASQITKALLDFRLVQEEGKDVKVSYYEPSIYSFLYGLYAEYTPGMKAASRFKILNPSLEHLRQKAHFYKLLLIKPSMLEPYLKMAWEKNLVAYEPTGGLNQYVLSHKTLDGLVDYILKEE